MHRKKWFTFRHAANDQISCGGADDANFPTRKSSATIIISSVGCGGSSDKYIYELAKESCQILACPFWRGIDIDERRQLKCLSRC